LQAPLQRLVQHKDFERVGDLRVRHATVRVVASVGNDDPSWTELLGDGVQVARIAIPPLRDRLADIVPLARRFVAAFARAKHKGSLVLTEGAEHALVTYDWPGNVAELKNAIERAVILCRTIEIGVDELPENVSPKSDIAPRLGGDFTIADIEREHIRRVVNRTASDLAAAKILGISRSTLWRRRGNSGSATLVPRACLPPIE
jgi:NtrC-family two-component system response regulator AlgB